MGSSLQLCGLVPPHSLRYIAGEGQYERALFDKLRANSVSSCWDINIKAFQPAVSSTLKPCYVFIPTEGRIRVCAGATLCAAVMMSPLFLCHFICAAMMPDHRGNYIHLIMNFLLM